MSTEVQQWRGVAADDITEELTAETTVRLAERSRRLLRDLLAPYRAAIWALVAIVLVENAARLSIPFLVKVGHRQRDPADPRHR